MSTVFVFEDSSAQRAAIAELLRSVGFEILEAGDGLDALSQIRQHLPDLVVADIISPNLNGYQLCLALKRDPKTRHIPIIFCSVKNQELDRVRGLTIADGYIAKPFQPPELVETLMCKLLDGGKSCVHPTPADDWTEVGLMWLQDFENQEWAVQAFEKALALEPNHDLAGKLKAVALGEVEKSRHCEACRYYYGGSPGGNLLVCAIHPHGPELDCCRDWESKYHCSSNVA